jgi:hypothetical protein
MGRFTHLTPELLREASTYLYFSKEEAFTSVSEEGEIFICSILKYQCKNVLAAEEFSMFIT